MAFTLNTVFLRTVNGMLKILEFALVLIVLFLARFGGTNGYMISWGSNSYTFLGIGATVGYAIIIPAIVLSYILGASPSALEFILNLVGCVLFISMGATLVEYGDIQAIVGGLAITLGIVFGGDFIYLCANTKCTVYQRTTTIQA